MPALGHVYWRGLLRLQLASINVRMEPEESDAIKTEKAAPSNVVNLMDALKKSRKGEEKEARAPAKSKRKSAK